MTPAFGHLTPAVYLVDLLRHEDDDADDRARALRILGALADRCDDPAVTWWTADGRILGERGAAASLATGAASELEAPRLALTGLLEEVAATISREAPPGAVVIALHPETSSDHRETLDRAAWETLASNAGRSLDTVLHVWPHADSATARTFEEELPGHDRPSGLAQGGLPPGVDLHHLASETVRLYMPERDPKPPRVPDPPPAAKHPPLPEPSIPPGSRRRILERLPFSVAFVVLSLANVLVLIAVMVPESLALPGLLSAAEQLLPLTVLHPGAGATVLAGCAWGASWVVADVRNRRRGSARLPWFTVLCALLVVVLALAIALPSPLPEWWLRWGASGVVAAGAAASLFRRRHRLPVPRDGRGIPWVPLLGLTVGVLPAVALGRLLAGGAGYEFARADWQHPTGWALASWSTLWLWLVGAFLIVSAACLVSVILPPVRRRSWGWRLIAGLVAGGLAVACVPIAADESTATGSRLMSRSPTSDLLAGACTVAWVGRTTVTLAGEACARVDVYEASVRVASTPVPHLRLDVARDFEPLPEMPATGRRAVAFAYHDAAAPEDAEGAPAGVLVALARAGDRLGLVGFDVRSGVPLWSRYCASGEPASARLVNDRRDVPYDFLVIDGTAAVPHLICGGVDVALDPGTGVPGTF